MYNKMIELNFNLMSSTVKEITDFFETIVKNLEPKEEKKKYSASSKKKAKGKRSSKKRIQDDFDFSNVAPIK